MNWACVVDGVADTDVITVEAETANAALEQIRDHVRMVGGNDAPAIWLNSKLRTCRPTGVVIPEYVIDWYLAQVG